MNKINFNRKSLVFGVGINDADYIVNQTINKKSEICHFYRRWHDMIKRCYSPVFHIKNKTYKNCTVSKEWLYFMTFREWMVRQDWRGKALDKDILIKGNKIYSPETCLFVPQYINNMLADNDKTRGEYAKGVFWSKQSKKFCSTIGLHNIKKNLGYFNTESEAESAYKKAKGEHIRKVAFQQSDYRIAKALLNHAP